MFCLSKKERKMDVCKKQQRSYHITPWKLPEDCKLEAEFTDIDLTQVAMKSLVITVSLVDVLDNPISPCGNCGCEGKSLEVGDMTIQKVKKLGVNGKTLKYPLVTLECDILCTGVQSKDPYRTVKIVICVEVA